MRPGYRYRFPASPSTHCYEAATVTETGVAPRFSIGSVLSVSIGVLVANFLPFLMLGLIVLAPIYLYAYYWPTLHPDMPQPGMTALIGFLEYLATLVLSASLIYGTVQELRGRRASMLACFGRGLELILPVLAVSIVVIVCVAVGFMALIVPGIIVTTMLWVAVPVAVIERPGVFKSLGRSARLTKGRRWSVLAILVIIAVCSALFEWMMRSVVTPRTAYSMDDLIPLFIVMWIISAFFAAFGACLSGVGYYFLRYDKEGADIDQIAAVFD